MTSKIITKIIETNGKKSDDIQKEIQQCLKSPLENNYRMIESINTISDNRILLCINEYETPSW